MSALDEIVKNLIGEYDAGNLEDASLAPVIKRIREGKATYGDVERLASQTGTRAGRLIAEQLAALSVDGRVTEEQARAVLMGLTSHNYDVVSGAAADVQESLNRRTGLGLKAVRPEFNRDRVEGLITEVVGKEDVPAFKNTLVQQVENVSVATVDDSVKVNAKAHYNAGLSPKIVRVTDGKCCKWCDALAGVHEYSQVNNTGNDVFRRHANCGCQVLYDPGDGKKWQDVHSKRLLSAAESDKIRVRKTVGLDEERKSPEKRVAEADALIGKRTRGYFTYDDPIREKLGSAYNSHPQEIEELKKQIKGKGITIFEEGVGMAYEPNPVPGLPGQIRIDPKASFSAWLHEYQHALDDESSGWQGYRNAYNPELLTLFEDKAYDVEIEFARSLGYEKIAKRLEWLKGERRREIYGKPKRHKGDS